MNPTGAADLHAPGSEHATCPGCDSGDHARCSAPKRRTRGPQNAEAVCCCREHQVLGEPAH